MIANRNALQKEATRRGDHVLLEEFRAMAKEVKKAVTNDKKVGIMRDLGDLSDSRNVWKTARNLLGINKNLSPTSIEDDKGNIITNPAKIAEIINTFFSDKVKKLRARTNLEPVVDPVQRLESWLSTRAQPPPAFKIREITRRELRDLVKNMKGGKSCGNDNIDSYSLKLAAPLIEDALLHIINLSIRTSCFSSHWKHQLIFPQFKKKDKLQAKNYRPVSHLVEIGLLVERAVSFQVVNHFTINNLFHNNHHGGIANHSTATALIQIHNLFLEASENKRLSAVLLLDQSAAYDLLDHKILIDKLFRYNFDHDSVSWFQSYLEKRSQSVLVGAQESPIIALGDHAGPQGSLLGGLLFLIHENDFPACRSEGDSVMFVDDDSDVVSDPEPVPLLEKLQHEANLSCDWLKDNRMVVAGDKSKMLIVGTKEMRRIKLGETVQSIVVDGEVVNESISEKLLGVIINNRMTWHEHLHGETWRTEGNSTGLISQLSQRLGMLRKLSWHSSRKRLKLLASGLFYSKLSYCLPLYVSTWGLDRYRDIVTRTNTFTKEDNRKLQVIQNHLCRMLLNTQSNYYRQNQSTKELLDQCGELSIHQMGAQQTLVMVQKIICTGKPDYLSKRIKVREARVQGVSTLLAPVDASLGVTRSSFIYRGVKLYNQLPEKIRKLRKLSLFKAQLKTWIQENIDVKP